MSGIIEKLQAEIESLKWQVAELNAIIGKQTVDNRGVVLKSPQEHRDEIVEMAKRDLEKLKERANGCYMLYKGVFLGACNAEFIINAEKCTVVCLLKSYGSGTILSRGIAKCAPNDCFNSHIGKAIALRRALELPVPDEYLNAPQPTEVRVGDIVETYIHGYPERYVVVGTDKEVEEKDGSCHIESIIVNYFPVKTKVIDDTREEV